MNLEPIETRNRTCVTELSTRNTCAVVLLDRRWATTVLVHRDPLGSLYPFQWGTAMTADAGGGSPPALLADAVNRAWRDMASKAPVRYDRCLICVSPSMTRSRDAVSRIPITPLPEDRTAVPRVTARHVAMLREAICTQNVSASSTVTEIVVQSYRDGEGHELPDPLTTITSSLEMRAHLVMTDQPVLTAVMDALRALRVRVHATVSPCAASTSTRLPQAAGGRFVSLEVSESDIAGAVVSDGRIVRTIHVDAGSNDVLKAAARRLGTHARTIGEWLQNHADLLVHGEDGISLSAACPPGHPPPATLGEMQEAANEATDRISIAVREAIRRAMPAAGTWPVVLSGDNRYACRALTAAMRKSASLDASSAQPDRIHGIELVSVVPGTARMAGTVRYWNVTSADGNAYLDAYYERHAPAVTQTLRRVRRNAGAWCGRQGARWSAGNPIRRIVHTLQSLLF